MSQVPPFSFPLPHIVYLFRFLFIPIFHFSSWFYFFRSSFASFFVSLSGHYLSFFITYYLFPFLRFFTLSISSSLLPYHRFSLNHFFHPSIFFQCIDKPPCSLLLPRSFFLNLNILLSSNSTFSLTFLWHSVIILPLFSCF